MYFFTTTAKKKMFYLYKRLTSVSLASDEKLNWRSYFSSTKWLSLAGRLSESCHNDFHHPMASRRLCVLGADSNYSLPLYLQSLSAVSSGSQRIWHQPGLRQLFLLRQTERKASQDSNDSSADVPSHVNLSVKAVR